VSLQKMGRFDCRFSHCRRLPDQRRARMSGPGTQTAEVLLKNDCGCHRVIFAGPAASWHRLCPTLDDSLRLTARKTLVDGLDRQTEPSAQLVAEALRTPCGVALGAVFVQWQ
jgi:hypothetical protein